MEEEDSPKSPGDSSSPAPPSPPPPILPTNDDVTATKPPQSPSRNALAVPTPSVGGGSRNGRSGGGGGGGGRDDCWSEEATKVLIEAWGERFSEPGKGTLKQQQWKEVAEVVNESRQCKYLKTDVQCKNRIDTVKKKYKLEKAKIASGHDGPSNWVFFKKLEALIGGGNAKAPAPMGRRQGKGTGLKRSSGGDSMRWHFRKRSASETESESDPEPDDSAESLPPLVVSKRLKMDEESGVGDVAKAILGFTEAYEKAETAKLKLMMELEKERMKFVKEMELQRMQFLKTQMDMTQNDQEEERSKPRRINDDDDDVKNNGDRGHHVITLDHLAPRKYLPRVKPMPQVSILMNGL
ncbi:trihelix transcription factor ASIL1 isoform X1 [Raphanus sativus]|uniref:Trihelix transcription factor ASIL1 isoform X1 n=1 Tax=Raphanus sativus TaxID=3726 RepID=A0A6J0NMT3_RAPSA|nr:trihelix transcription factor ASIL1 isoform X1 [Raphanus sativus]